MEVPKKHKYTTQINLVTILFGAIPAAFDHQMSDPVDLGYSDIYTVGVSA
jgi:hypothetical protein